MNILKTFQQKYPLHPLVWYLIIETALARAAFFMVMPFVALRMHDVTGTSATVVGATVGIGPLVATVVGFYVSHLSDQWGRRRIILMATALWVADFYLFSFAESAIDFALLMALNGLARGIFEPVSSALISDICMSRDESGELKKFSFHIRYFAINVGAAIGPLIGATLLLSQPKLGFQIAAGVYALSGLCFWIVSRRFGIRELEMSITRGTHRFIDALKVLAGDRTLQVYIVAAFLISIAFSQVDVTLALDLKDQLGDEGVYLFGKLMTLNGFIVVCFTAPILKAVKSVDVNLSCAVSGLVLVLGFILVSFAQDQSGYLLAMVFMTLGEIVIFANGYYVIESLAPAHMRGVYLAAANLSQLGIVVGPTIGGFIFEAAGGQIMFLAMAGLTALASGLYLLAKRA